MEKKHRSCPLGSCEKIFKAITINPAFRTIRRISHNPQDPMLANPSRPASIPITKTHDSPHPSKPLEGAQHLKKSKNKEAAAEVVPIKFDNSSLPPPPNEKAKSATPNAPVRKNGQVGSAVPNTEPLAQIVPLLKVKTKGKVATDMAQPGKAHVPSYGQVAKVASKIEPEPPVISAQQKPKPVAEKTSPANVFGSHGQGGNAKSGAPPKFIKEEGGNSGVNPDDRCTDYINRTKIKIRAISNVGDGKSSAAAEDTSRDHFSDYINRAKLKIRTMSSFIGGRSDSFK